MTEGIEFKIKELLDEKGFSLNFDPSTKKYTPWYNLPFSVEFEVDGLMAYANIAERKIGIPRTNWMYKTIEPKAGSLLHEAAHAETFPIEFPLSLVAALGVASRFDEPWKQVAAFFGFCIAYNFTIREMITEGYNCIRYGTKKYLKLCYGDIFNYLKNSK